MPAAPARADVARANPERARDLFAEGMRARAAGEATVAVAALRQAYEADPAGPLAADSLSFAAQTLDVDLRDLDGACSLYRSLLERFPASRHRLRAEARLGFVERGRAGGDAPFLRYEGVLHRYSELGSDEALARMTALVAEHPAFPYAPRVQLWIGEERFAREEWWLATAAYREVVDRWPRSDEAALARKGIGDVAVKRARWSEALAAYAEIPTDGGPGSLAPVVHAGLLRSTAEMRTRSWIARASGLFATLFVVALLARVRWAEVLRPGFPGPGRELAVLGPPLAAIVFLARHEHPIVFRSLATACLGFAALAAANALYVQTRRPRGWHARLAHPLGLATTCLSILYGSCYVHGLHLLLEETLRTGPD